MSNKTKNGRTLIYTCVDKEYSHWIPLYCLGMLYHNSDIDIEIGMEGRLCDEELQSIEYLRKKFPKSIIKINEELFDREGDFALINNIKCLFNTVRFITTPTIIDEYVYIGDVDIICLERDIFTKHIEFMNMECMDYSNMVRDTSPPRLTGLHFTFYDCYYPLPSFEGINMMKNDEDILTDIVVRKGITLNYLTNFRPVHGIHFSKNRPSVRGNSKIPGWGAEPYAVEWLNFINSEEYQFIVNKLNSSITCMIDKVNIYFSEEFKLIEDSNMFDSDWFINEYSLDNVDPIIFYLENWDILDLNPSPNFNSREYLNVNKDVEKSGLNPLVHYIKYGKKENRLIKEYSYDLKYKEEYKLILNSDLFDGNWFSEEYSLDNADPIIFYLENWDILDLNPSPNFNSREYLNVNKDVEKSGLNPLVHYIKYGKKENRLLR